MTLTVLLLARQDGTLRRHRHDGELGEARVHARRHSGPRRLAQMVDGRLRTHRGGLCSTVELDSGRGVR